MVDAATAPCPNVRMKLLGIVENVPFVRELLMGLGEALALGAETTDDIRTAVTEACNNTVQHAYAAMEGPIEIDVWLQREAIEVTVRDRGIGMTRSRREADAQASGIGMMIIKALTERVEFSDREGGGLEVQMRFAAEGMPRLDPANVLCCDDLERLPDATIDSLALATTPPELAAAVMPRLLGALAAKAHMSTDRITDLQIVGDSIAAHAPRSLRGGCLSAGIGVAPRSVELSVGPLRAGGVEQLLADSKLGSLGPVIRTLSDYCTTVRDAADETLVVRLADHRR